MAIKNINSVDSTRTFDNLFVNQSSKLKQISKDNVFNLIYPVGSVYVSVNSTDPSTLFGGTWERIKDKFLLSAGDTYSAGTTGGEATHKLTVDEMPAHNHSIAQSGYAALTTDASSGFIVGDMGVQSGTGRRYIYNTGTFDVVRQNVTGNSGGSTAHNNMPPYLSVYVWKRTA